ncbi:glycosyltransferase [Deinococcus enclensis]|uniref:Glycosyltransferase involved in cell wall biosynthesis n=1 Tax=Deinococcus enclensis TaxID=1049582 RepID=A0ABT9MBP6_9DEIO|nr:glycosyltransferase involved in cell wall biosynthesis [Deinococcus enclensis]
MATYNGERHIAEQIMSIMQQLDSDDEIVVIDDQSSDETLKILKSFNDSRIKISVNVENLGVVKTFERSIQKSLGEIVILADQDDVWLPGRVDFIKNILSSSEECLMVTDAYIFNDKNIELETFFEYRRSKPGFFANLIKNSFIGCCIAFKSSLKSEILPFPIGIPMHDQWIGLIAELNGGTIFSARRYTAYRRHSENVTSMTHGNFHAMILKRINLSIELLNYLSRRRF